MEIDSGNIVIATRARFALVNSARFSVSEKAPFCGRAPRGKPIYKKTGASMQAPAPRRWPSLRREPAETGRGKIVETRGAGRIGRAK